MYKHWARMELDLKEWNKAAEAAEAGLRRKPHSKQLLYLAGLARSRSGQEIYSRFQEASAAEELRRSLDHLGLALRCRSGFQDDPDLDAAIYRATAISAYHLGDRLRLIETFSGWFRDFPSDPHASDEWDRISARLSLSRSELSL